MVIYYSYALWIIKKTHEICSTKILVTLMTVFKIIIKKVTENLHFGLEKD